MTELVRRLHAENTGAKANYHKHIRSAYYVIMLIIILFMVTVMLWFGASQWGMLESINDTITQVNDDVLPMVNEYADVINNYMPIIDEYIGYVDYYIPIIDDYISVLDPIMKKASCVQECRRMMDQNYPPADGDPDFPTYTACGECGGVEGGIELPGFPGFPEIPSLPRKIPRCTDNIITESQCAPGAFITYSGNSEKACIGLPAVRLLTNDRGDFTTCRYVEKCGNEIEAKLDQYEDEDANYLTKCKKGLLGREDRYVFSKGSEITGCALNTLGSSAATLTSTEVCYR